MSRLRRRVLSRVRPRIQPRIGGVAGATLRALYDLSRPTVQTFPTTPAGLATIVGQTPGHIYAFNESASPVLDLAGSANLAEAGTVLYQRETPFYDGSSFSKQSIEFPDGSGNRVAGAGVTQPGATSYAVLIVFSIGTPPSSSRQLVGARDSLSPNRGWEVVIEADGDIAVTIDDDTNAGAATATGNHADGAPHVALLVINRTANTLDLWTDIASSTGNSIATVGSVTPTATDVSVGDGRTSAPLMHAHYLAIFTGAAAEALGQTELDAFWLHGKHPLSSVLNQYARASLAADAIGADRVAYFSGGPATPQTQMGWRDSANGTKLGLCGYPDYTNHAVRSRPDSSLEWALANAPTETTFDVDSPFRFRDATRLVGSVAGSQSNITLSGLSATTDYAFSFWAKTTATYDGQLFGFQFNADTIATYALTQQWQRFTFLKTSDGVPSNIVARIYAGDGTTAKEIHVWGAQFNEGNQALPLLPSEGAKTTSAQIKTVIDSSILYLLPKGRVSADVLLDYQPAISQFLWDRQSNGNGNDDRKRVIVNASLGPSLQVFEFDGTLITTTGLGALSLDTLYTLVASWNNEQFLADGANNIELSGNGTANQDFGRWVEEGHNIDRFYVGSSSGSGAGLHGIMQTIKVEDVGPIEVARETPNSIIALADRLGWWTPALDVTSDANGIQLLGNQVSGGEDLAGGLPTAVDAPTLIAQDEDGTASVQFVGTGENFYFATEVPIGTEVTLYVFAKVPAQAGSQLISLLNTALAGLRLRCRISSITNLGPGVFSTGGGAQSASATAIAAASDTWYLLRIGFDASNVTTAIDNAAEDVVVGSPSGYTGGWKQMFAPGDNGNAGVGLKLKQMILVDKHVRDADAEDPKIRAFVKAWHPQLVSW